MHSKCLDAHVELQQFELKKKLLENKLKVLVGENQGIKENKRYMFLEKKKKETNYKKFFIKI